MVYRKCQISALFSIVRIVSYAAGSVTMGIFLYLVTMDSLEAHLAIGIVFGICGSLRLVSKQSKLVVNQ